MLEDLQLRNYSSSTIESYIWCVANYQRIIKSDQFCHSFPRWHHGFVQRHPEHAAPSLGASVASRAINRSAALKCTEIAK